MFRRPHSPKIPLKRIAGIKPATTPLSDRSVNLEMDPPTVDALPLPPDDKKLLARERKQHHEGRCGAANISQKEYHLRIRLYAAEALGAKAVVTAEKIERERVKALFDDPDLRREEHDEDRVIFDENSPRAASKTIASTEEEKKENGSPSSLSSPSDSPDTPDAIMLSFTPSPRT